jgi:hypothetical protein
VVTIPAFVWRSGSFSRGLTIGVAVGAFFGLLAWVDSGILLAAVLVLVILGTFWGIAMARRMARYWPGAKQLSGADREAVARAARRGERIGDVRLAQAVIDYSEGLRAAAENARPFRWLVRLVLAVAAVMAVWDTVFGSTRDAVASFLYIALLAIELFWWPRKQDQLLSNAERAEELARPYLSA